VCSIFLAYRAHPLYRLIVAANRDEFFDRPTAPARYWCDQPRVLAGRDLRGGGTWLGLGPDQRFAAVTNFRDPSAPAGTKSRGLMVRDFIAGDEDPQTFLTQVASERTQYSGFNLFAADAKQLWYFSNRDTAPRQLAAGVFGLSNHLLDTRWPKVERGKVRLRELVETGSMIRTEALFELLADDAQAADTELPDTGIGIAKERALSSIFIRTPDYGTRSATVLLIDDQGNASFTERTFESAGNHDDRHFLVPASEHRKAEQLATV
jgi:uncharacterized protein with NRDE domain